MDAAARTSIERSDEKCSMGSPGGEGGCARSVPAARSAVAGRLPVGAEIRTNRTVRGRMGGSVRIGARPRREDPTDWAGGSAHEEAAALSDRGRRDCISHPFRTGGTPIEQHARAMARRRLRGLATTGRTWATRAWGCGPSCGCLAHTRTSGARSRAGPELFVDIMANELSLGGLPTLLSTGHRVVDPAMDAAGRRIIRPRLYIAREAAMWPAGWMLVRPARWNRRPRFRSGSRPPRASTVRFREHRPGAEGRC